MSFVNISMRESQERRPICFVCWITENIVIHHPQSPQQCEIPGSSRNAYQGLCFLLDNGAQRRLWCLHNIWFIYSYIQPESTMEELRASRFRRVLASAIVLDASGTLCSRSQIAAYRLTPSSLSSHQANWNPKCNSAGGGLQSSAAWYSVSANGAYPCLWLLNNSAILSKWIPAASNDSWGLVKF